MLAGRRSMGTDKRAALGLKGEAIACEELTRRGYRILDRRYRTRFGEIDIVAEHDGVVVFVEVKARESTSFGGAAEAVHARKRRRILGMAVDYVARRGLQDRPCRFDVVAVSIGENGA